ncbi:MAG: ribosomal-processing cysteine protease Prp [Clostridiales bacterium]|jgi:uncharacterized protein YsxB (DUF464 family)|nr:ribosomal-processing cysteine protease Prp [Clostridiales bacterium]
MIRAVIYRDPLENIVGFEVSGHSGYSERGKDIVCAAVSAIVQTAVIGLTEVLGIKVDYRQKAGEARCIIPEELSGGQIEKINIILKTMLHGLMSIQEGYSDYIRVEERRLN